jgi:hypothetical protein
MKPVIATILAGSVAGCVTISDYITAVPAITERPAGPAAPAAPPPAATPGASYGAKYDASWYMSPEWSGGEYPHGFTMTANVTLKIRPVPDPGAPKSTSCTLRQGSTFHPFNRSRVASDHLEFVTFTRIVTYELEQDYSADLTPEPDGGNQNIAFKKGDRWSYLTAIAEEEFLIRIGDKTYRANQGLYQVSREVGAAVDHRQGTPEERQNEWQRRNHEWMKLTCANGATGWILYNEVSNAPGFSRVDACEGCAEDRPAGKKSSPDKRQPGR